MKLRTESAIFIPLIIIAAYIRISNLWGARFINLDEYRAGSIELGHTILFGILYRVPFELFGWEQHVALYTSALLGLATLALFYQYTSRHFGISVATFSTLFLAFNPIHMRYSRSAFPVTLQILFLTIASDRIFKLYRLKKPTLSAFALSGFLIACSLLVYVPSYSALIGIVGAYISANLHHGRKFSAAVKAQLFLLVATALAYLALLSILVPLAGTDISIYFRKFVAIQQLSREFVEKTTLGSQLGALFELIGMMGRPLSVFLIGALVVSLLKGRAFGETLIALGVAYGSFAFLTIGALGVHTFSDRHFVQFIPALCLLAGIQCQRMIPLLGARATHTIVALLLLSSTWHAVGERARVFRVQPILNWLQANNATASEVATLVDLMTTKSAGGTQLPVIWSNPKKQFPTTFSVDWPALETQYRNKQVKYILISTFYQIALHGEREAKLLKGPIQPVAMWSQPVAGDNSLLLYDLHDVFMAQNVDHH